MTGVLQRKSSPASILGAKRRQQQRIAAGQCLLSSKHGPVYKARRCRSCYKRTLKRRVERYVRRADRPRPVTFQIDYQFRAAVMRDVKRYPGENEIRYTRRLAAEVEIRLRDAGYQILGVNEPPVGWSVEYDRREELIALGQITAARKVG